MSATTRGPSDEVRMPLDEEYSAAVRATWKTYAGYMDFGGGAGGFLRTWRDPYTALRPDLSEDPYISQSQARSQGVRQGDLVDVNIRPPKEGEKYRAVAHVNTVNGLTVDAAKVRPHFNQKAETAAVDPTEWIKLESSLRPKILSLRLIDLVAPIGRGQRVLIMAGGKTGKTTILQEIAFSILTQQPDIILGVVLIGERGEEVERFRKFIRNVLTATNAPAERAMISAACFDDPTEDWVKVAEDAMEAFKRLAESSKNVVVLFDSMTRYAEAKSDLAEAGGGKLSGGLDASAVFPMRSLIGTGRKLATGGSLTMFGTCLAETASKFEQVVAEKLAFTVNCVIRLDSLMATYLLWPAIDGIGSGTRRDHEILPKETYDRVMKLRKHMTDMAMGFGGYIDLRTHAVNVKVPHLVMEPILEALGKTKSNEEFLTSYLATLSEK